MLHVTEGPHACLGLSSSFELKGTTEAGPDLHWTQTQPESGAAHRRDQTGKQWVERCRYFLKILFFEFHWDSLERAPVQNSPWSEYHSLPGPLFTWYPLFFMFYKWRKHPILVLKPWLLMGPQSCLVGPHLTPATSILSVWGFCQPPCSGGCLLVVSFRCLPVWAILANDWNALMDFNN